VADSPSIVSRRVVLANVACWPVSAVHRAAASRQLCSGNDGYRAAPVRSQRVDAVEKVGDMSPLRNNRNMGADFLNRSYALDPAREPSNINLTA
jgi:hypothetical protein